MKVVHRGVTTDGGWGWVILAASFILMMLGFGTLYSLSVLYVSWLDEFESGKGTTSWIVSVAAGLAYSLAPLPAGVARRYGYRVVTFIGAFLCSLGFFLSYFATSVYFLMVTIGVITGSGLSFCYLPAISMVGLYFSKRRALAMGVATSGAAVGVFVLSPFINWLVEEYTWRGCILILSAYSLNGIVCGSVMRPLEEFSILETKDDEYKSILDQEDKSDLKEGKGFEANEPIGNVWDCEGKENARDTNLIPDEVKESLQTNLISGENVLIECGNKMLCSENSFDKTADAKTNLHNEHNRNKPNIGGSLKQLTSSIDDSAHVRKAFSERQINLWNKTGKHTNLTNSKLHNLGISVGSSFHSLLLAENNLSSLLSVHSDCRDRIEEQEEKDTTIRRCCSHFASALRPYLQLLRNGVFLVLGISNFVTNLSYLMPVLYMVDRAVENNIDKTSAAILLSLFGASSLFVRIIMGFVADLPCMDKLVCYIASLMVCGISTSLSALCGDSLALHGVYSFVFGGFIGSYSSLAPVVTAELVDVQYIGVAFSIILAFTGPATVIGSPLAGWIVDWTGSYNISFIINGIFLFLSAAMLLPILWRQRHNVQKVQLDDR